MFDIDKTIRYYKSTGLPLALGYTKKKKNAQTIRAMYGKNKLTPFK